MIGDGELATRFTYHAPKGDQTERYQTIRDQAHILALHIDELAPDGDEKDLAVRSLEQAVMWANAAIARRE